MTEQRTPRAISSFTTPTEADLAYFENLPDGERRALLCAEIDKGVASGLSARTFDEIIAEAKSVIHRAQ